MSIPAALTDLVGTWSGTNRLHLGEWAPENPIVESSATAVVKSRLSGQFLEISYTWAYEGETKEGVFLLGLDPKSKGVHAFWTDSWHLAHQLMECRGQETEEGCIDVKGSYKVDGHPDWGWRTKIIPGPNSFQYLMYNVSPEGTEEIAVEMILSTV